MGDMADTAAPIRGTAGRSPGEVPTMSTDYGYDLWWLVIINSAVFIIFALRTH